MQLSSEWFRVMSNSSGGWPTVEGLPLSPWLSCHVFELLFFLSLFFFLFFLSLSLSFPSLSLSLTLSLSLSLSLSFFFLFVCLE